ncbi:unnamed protein product [Rotaria magnacalcarata]|uniref:Methyltransferase type 11 domain-containing protein n=1 Tax=Rotaria magnacalcarata TaxID=392030 RepID=A0A820GE88_9BILA|nr:unnamed protein product [Rotaria magnacalcarata]CAF4277756.1 unnamed protein product [Rotaria magnacalcarata]
MAEKTRLTTEEFLSLWNDDNNTLAPGIKIDVVECLVQQRSSEYLIDAKERAMKVMKLDQFEDSQQVKILDLGCGLGIDLILVAEEAVRLGKTVSIIGLEINPTLIEEAKKLYELKKHCLTSNVSIEIVHGDIRQMVFHDKTFDIVRCDLCLEHVDLSKTLLEIKRVLKVNGRLIALEDGAGNVYSSDEVLIKTYDSILPSRRDGGTAIGLQFMLPNMNFDVIGLISGPFLQSAQEIARNDKDWIKLRALGESMVTKGVLTEDENKDFCKRFIEACGTNRVIVAAMFFVIEAVKQK